MPWQVIDLEESSDKAIHKLVEVLVMYLRIFFHRDQGSCSNTCRLTRTASLLLFGFQVLLPGPAEC